MLGMLRGLRQDRGKHCLHSTVLLGPYTIMRQGTRDSGPAFGVNVTVPMKPFTQAQVSSLFAQLAEARAVDVDPLVAVDVFERTEGDCGLVGW